MLHLSHLETQATAAGLSSGHVLSIQGHPAHDVITSALIILIQLQVLWEWTFGKLSLVGLLAPSQ